MKSREIRIHQVDPSADGAAIRAVLERNLPDAARAERFDWHYRANPDGPALVWLAQDAAGTPVGTSAAYPRRMHVDGRTVQALNLSDFAVDTAYRSLGPALQLLRATLEPVRSGEYAFSYDFPSESMRALYRRMGGLDLGRKERWVRPVDLRPIAKRKMGGGIVGSVVGAAGQAALRARDALSGVRAGLEIEPLAGDCGAEFDALDDRLGRLRPVTGVRDAEYLNWRYSRSPLAGYMILCARRDGDLKGFVVLCTGDPEVVAVLDLFAPEGDGIRRGLIAGAVEFARRRGAEALWMQVLADSGSAHAAQALGFVKRDDTEGPVPFAAPDSPHRATLAEADNWWITGGDRDF
ncbi:MAG: GNAT family N-acetyltransferase [Planctomycetota bacterium]|jgi:GNAT superfamily N-acetyltransferase